MKLPGGETAVVEERKIRDYLMNAAHADGASKAQFFARRGYNEGDWERLAEDLRRHGRQNDVTTFVESPYGTRYVVEGPLRTPSGDRVRLATIWIVETGTETPRLVTAYPV